MKCFNSSPTSKALEAPPTASFQFPFNLLSKRWVTDFAADPELRGKETRPRFLRKPPPHTPPWRTRWISCSVRRGLIGLAGPLHATPTCLVRVRVAPLISRLQKPAIFSESLIFVSSAPDRPPPSPVQSVCGGRGKDTRSVSVITSTASMTAGICSAQQAGSNSW